MLITGGDVNAARGNFAQSGLFVTPTSDTDYAAYENLVEWIGGANTYLRSSKSGIPQLQCAETVLKAARAALRNKLRMQEYPSMQRMIELLREDAMCPALEIVSHEALGQGSRLVLQKKGNMDVAFNTQAATKFCQIRDIYEDPNEWQFWLQTGYDTRIRDWHEKAFRCNEQRMNHLIWPVIIVKPELFKWILPEPTTALGAFKGKQPAALMDNVFWDWLRQLYY